VSVELRDVDGTLVEEEDPGLLAVRGDNLFSGYWPDGHGGPDADGWFVTGDLAYADGNGELFLVGRETDMVLVNGFNVYPAEVESVLRRAEGVGAVAVVGVPDEVTGEAVHAYVVPARGREVDAAAVLADAARSLARFKLPREIEVVDSLPLTVTGKVKKWQLKTTA
jgi:long-chain acyl-CoA synthetase